MNGKLYIDEKNRVQKTLSFINCHNFVAVDIDNYVKKVKVYYKCVKNIFIVFYYFNSKQKNYNQHCFDLFVTESLNNIRTGNFGDYNILSFDINNTSHISILNYLLSYSENESFKNLNERLKMKRLND